MGSFRIIEHLSQYRWPLWNAQLPEHQSGKMISLAALKLTNGQHFLPMDQHHVFAVLSQHLCLDPVLANSEAAELADCSVVHHMRLLTSFSANGETFYTHSPSEPILALGSIDILYMDQDNFE
ncbi:hypothetical protein BU17DRAFT_88503 [Hysterangium stoloniferum]|nr:hypothetical protein BU17DRAFT_88503 [Hysterangium stoloniferum]